MKELSLHILDIAKNSVKAKATLIEISIVEDVNNNLLTIEIKDNGCGMSKEFLKTVKDPFSTTRTTRKVGMGIPLFEAACIQCGGELNITSELGVGTTLTATFELDNIDRAPIGDMAGTIQTLISGSPAMEFIYRHIKNSKTFVLDTREIRQVLGDVPLDTIDVLMWIDGYVNEGLNELN